MKRKQGRIAVFTAIVGAVLLATGCTASGSPTPSEPSTDISQIENPHMAFGDPPGEGGTPVKGGDLTVGMFADINSFDTIAKLNIPAMAIYDQLMRYDENGEAVPYLASSMETSDGGKTWVLGLRPDVRFHDGTPLDADAVIYNIQRIIDLPEAAAHLYASDIETLTAEDELTVRLVLKEPNASFSAFFAENPSIASLGVVGSPTAIEKWGADYTNHPVGAGPYKFVSWARGDKAVLERNDDYWQEGLPHLDTITFVPRVDADTRAISLENGEVDLIESNGVNDFLRLVGNPEHKYYLGGEGGTYLPFNHDKAPFDDLRMRQAAVMAIDYDQMSEVLFDGQMERAETPIGKSSAYYSEEAAEAFPDTDQEAAKKLVEEYVADGGDPSFTLEGGNSASAVKTQQFLQAQWEAVGMKVDLKQHDLATLIKEIREVNFNISSKGFHGSSQPYPLLEELFETGAYSNLNRYSNPKMDELLEQARNATSEEERIRLYNEVQVLANEDVVNLWYAPGFLGLIAKTYVHGVVRGSSGPTFFADIWRE
jgi:peptide/nickel transport system substrate-binding protein